MRIDVADLEVEDKVVAYSGNVAPFPLLKGVNKALELNEDMELVEVNLNDIDKYFENSLDGKLVAISVPSLQSCIPKIDPELGLILDIPSGESILVPFTIGRQEGASRASSVAARRLFSTLGLPFSIIEKTTEELALDLLVHFKGNTKAADRKCEFWVLKDTMAVDGHDTQVYVAEMFRVFKSGGTSIVPSLKTPAEMLAIAFAELKADPNCPAAFKKPGVDLTLKRGSFGYRNKSCGNHTMDLSLKGAELDFGTDGSPDMYFPNLTLVTPFEKCRTQTPVLSLGLTFLRQVCSNGMCVELSPARLEGIRSNIVKDAENDEATPGNDVYRIAASGKKTLYKNEGEFRQVLASNFLYGTPLSLPYEAWNVQTFKNILQVLGEILAFSTEISDEVRSTNVSLEEVDANDFIAEFELNYARMGFRSGQLRKEILTQYAQTKHAIAEGNMEEEDEAAQPFKTTHNLMNYMTYLSKYYDMDTVRSTEAKVYDFTKALASSLLKKEVVETPMQRYLKLAA